MQETAYVHRYVFGTSAILSTIIYMLRSYLGDLQMDVPQWMLLDSFLYDAIYGATRFVMI